MTFPSQQLGIGSTAEWNDDESTLNGSSVCSGSSQWDGSTYRLRPIGHGTAGIVFALDDERVVKIYVGADNRSQEDFETERQAYRNMARGSRHVLKCLDISNSEGLVLERCQGTLRSRIRSRRGEYLPQNDALKYAIQAAKGLAFVHSHGIIQRDVGCHNMLIDRRGLLKIADFAGSSVEGSLFPGTVNYEVGSKIPGHCAPSIKSDIFALGSAIYEMISGKPPHKGKDYVEVQRKFRMGIFPDDFEPCPKLKPIVEKCWGLDWQGYTSMEEVCIDLCRMGGSKPNFSDMSKPIYNKQKTQAPFFNDSVNTGLTSTPKVQPPSTKERRRKEATYVDLHTRKKRSKHYHGEPNRDMERRNHRRKQEGNMFSQLINSFCSLRVQHKQSSTSRPRRRD